MGHLEAGKGTGAVLCPPFLSKIQLGKRLGGAALSLSMEHLLKHRRNFGFNGTVAAWEAGEGRMKADRLR